MRRPGALSQREAAHRALLDTIGRRLREHYDVTQSLPDHLRDLIERIAQAERAAAHRTGVPIAAAARADHRAPDLTRLIAELQTAGVASLRQVAGALNDRGIAAPGGGKWNAAQVRKVLAAIS